MTLVYLEKSRSDGVPRKGDLIGFVGSLCPSLVQGPGSLSLHDDEVTYTPNLIPSYTLGN